MIVQEEKGQSTVKGLMILQSIMMYVTGYNYRVLAVVCFLSRVQT